MKYLLTILSIFLVTIIMEAQCDVRDITAVVLSCDDEDNFDVEINFIFENPAGEDFQVIGNGQVYGVFDYMDLPVTLSGLEGNCSTEYEFIIRDSANPACSDFFDLGIVCCDVECDIAITSTSFGGCANGFIDLLVDIEYEGIINPIGVDVFGPNGFTQFVSYDDLPASLPMFPTGSNSLTSIIVCNNDSECCDTITMLNPCICAIGDGSALVVDCSEGAGNFFVNLDFEHSMTSDSFVVGGDVEFLGKFAYDDLPVLVGPIGFNTGFLELLVVDSESALSFNGFDVGVVDDCDLDCVLNDVFAEVYGCEDGIYNIDFEFDATYVEIGQLFSVQIDSVVIDSFMFGDLFYTLEGVALVCNEPFEISITVLDVSPCSGSYIVDDVSCCTCPFSNFAAEVECGGDPTLIFDYASNMPFGEYVIIVGDIEFGPYNYGTSPTIELPELEPGTYIVQMIDVDLVNCIEAVEIAIDCDAEECSISNVIYEFYEECDGNTILLDIEVSGTAVSDSFDVNLGDLLLGTFAYSSPFSTLGPLELDCLESYELRLVDSEDPSCVKEILLEEVPCCSVDCNLLATVSDFTCISQDSGFVTIELDVLNAAEEPFIIYLNGVVIDSVSLSDFPYQLFFTLQEQNAITVAQVDNSDCLLEYEIEADCEECVIGELGFDVVECMADTFTLLINFDYDGNDGAFLLQGNGIIYGEFSYADLPITLENLVISSSDVLEFVAIDVINDDCSNAIEVGPLVCDTASEDTLDDRWSVYVSGDILNIDIVENAQSRLTLYNLDGKLLLGKEIRDDIQLYMSHYQSGIYFVTVEQENTVATKKIVVVR